MNKSFQVCLVLLSCLTLTTNLWAQGGGANDFSAGRKITGSVYRPQTYRSYHQGATQHARVLQQYAQQHKTVPQDTAKEHAGQVRHNLEVSKKELAKLAPEVKGDAVAMKLIGEIQKHQAKALEACDMLDMECAKHHPEGVKLSGCCADMVEELKAADELHEKLLKHLKYEEPGKVKAPVKPTEQPKK